MAHFLQNRIIIDFTSILALKWLKVSKECDISIAVIEIGCTLLPKIWVECLLTLFSAPHWMISQNAKLHQTKFPPLAIKDENSHVILRELNSWSWRHSTDSSGNKKKNVQASDDSKWLSKIAQVRLITEFEFFYFLVRRIETKILAFSQLAGRNVNCTLRASQTEKEAR